MVARDASSPSAVFGDTAATTALTTASFTPPSGSILLAWMIAGDAGTTVSSVTSTGPTFTSRLNIGSGGLTCRVALFTATGAGAAITVTGNFAGSANVRELLVGVYTGAQLAATPATHSTNVTTPPTGAPTDTLTTAAANSFVAWVNADYSAIDGTTRTYRSSATETSYHTVVGQQTVYTAYQTAATAGSQTYGLTAPTGQTYTLASIEVQDTGGTPALPPSGIWSPYRTALIRAASY